MAHRRPPIDVDFLADWRAQLHAVEAHRWTGRDSHGKRMTLRAVLLMAQRTKSRYIDTGTRGLAVAAGLDHGTIAGHLRDLRDEPDPLIVLVEDDRGVRGDLYELRLPAHTEQDSRLPWRRGKTHACRPVFRVLGQPAAFVYEALEQTRDGVDTGDLALATGLSRSTVYASLGTLAGWDLVTLRHGRWYLGTTDASQVGHLLGADALQTVQIARYRRQRRAWWAHLGLVITHRHDDDAMADWVWPPPPPLPDHPPDEDDQHDDLVLVAAATLVTKILAAPGTGAPPI